MGAGRGLDYRDHRSVGMLVAVVMVVAVLMAMMVMVMPVAVLVLKIGQRQYGIGFSAAIAHAIHSRLNGRLILALGRKLVKPLQGCHGSTQAHGM